MKSDFKWMFENGSFKLILHLTKNNIKNDKAFKNRRFYLKLLFADIHI